MVVYLDGKEGTTQDDHLSPIQDRHQQRRKKPKKWVELTIIRHPFPILPLHRLLWTKIIAGCSGKLWKVSRRRCLLDGWRKTNTQSRSSSVKSEHLEKHSTKKCHVALRGTHSHSSYNYPEMVYSEADIQLFSYPTSELTFEFLHLEPGLHLFVLRVELVLSVTIRWWLAFSRLFPSIALKSTTRNLLSDKPHIASQGRIGRMNEWSDHMMRKWL